METKLFYLVCPCAALILSPLLPGIINKVKAFFAGRKGPSVFQLYFDIFKLLKKESVYSSSTTGLFRLAPLVTLAALLGATFLLPAPGYASFFGFTGDLILFLYLCGLARASTVLCAMDTGSSFEGMGASRECQFALISEGTVLAVFCGMVLLNRDCSLAGLMCNLSEKFWYSNTISMVLFFTAFFLVVLTESCRVPVDDPDTHLELTMIHEAMILDNSGPDLGIIHYAASLKMWILFYLEGMFFLPRMGKSNTEAMLVLIAFVLVSAVVTGVIESIMARFRFKKLPQVLSGGFVCALLGVILLILF